MSVILDQIRKAEQKAQPFDIAKVVNDARGKAPQELASQKEKTERQQFLRDSLQDIDQADKYFERILLGNELQDVNYLERGAIASRSVARIAIRASSGTLRGWGTGFLIAPGVLLTNHHVLSDHASAIRSEAHFSFERNIDGAQLPPQIFALQPDKLYFSEPALDFTVVAIAPTGINAEIPLSAFGYLPLLDITGKVSDGEWLTIIQHPNGELKQLCVRENKLVRRTENELWYSTDTLGGSSGSPVFNNDWFVVALHHSGVPFKIDGKIQTVEGRDFDANQDGEDKIRWVANEGIRVSRIVTRLRQQLAGHSLLQPLFNATPETARIAATPIFRPPSSLLTASTSTATSENLNMPTPTALAFPRHVSVTLHIDNQGNVSLGTPDATQESALLEVQPKKKSEERAPAFDVPFNADYRDRRGFDQSFLGAGAIVHLPVLSLSMRRVASKQIGSDNDDGYVLAYHNFSVVMHSARRFAIYSAANVRNSERYKMSRPGDVWRTDPRIPQEHQIGNFYYKSNKFDRGHLTRREDLEFGPTAVDALASAADTCHWTNCTPQHAQFNQNKQLWQGLEGYVLENGLVQGRFDVQVFTGPILEEDDPVYKPFPKIQYPVRFWKVLTALDTDGQLFTTAYILDQSEVIAQFGIEEAAPYGEYQTFQVAVSEVERLTGLTFTGELDNKPIYLRDHDPFVKATAKSRRRAPRVNESAQVNGIEGYRPLQDLGDIVLD